MREITFAKAIREALYEEMKKNENVYLMGESIQHSVWGVTRGLDKDFSVNRVVNVPISESGFVGAAFGSSLIGLRPVVELIFGDFLLLAADSIANEMAKYRYMCGGGEFKAPVTIRVAGCGIGTGAGPHHSQYLEGLFLIFPGLRIIAPSTPYNAKGLLKSAIEDNNPVLFFEYKLLYGIRGEVPEKEYTIPIGKAKISREGKDITVFAFGHSCYKTILAAKELANKGIDIEVIDPRTLVPFDKETLFDSLKKTNKLIIVEDGIRRGGFGSEVASIVAEEALYLLDAPIVRISGKEAPIPGSKYGEKFMVPSVEEIVNICENLYNKDL